MRIVFLIILALPASLIAQEASPVADGLNWENIGSTYLSFEEMKPVLINQSTVPIYLSRLYPHYYAQLERYNEQTGGWEMGRWGITCATVSEPTVPIEIRPNSQRKINVGWQLSVDDLEQPTAFVVAESRATRSLEGRYRLVLRYALQPWVLFRRPLAIYQVVSQEFLLVEPLHPAG